MKWNGMEWGKNILQQRELLVLKFTQLLKQVFGE